MNQKALVEFVKNLLDLRSDAALARLLNESPASFNANKIRGTIDLVRLRELYEIKNADPKILDDYLLYSHSHDSRSENGPTDLYRTIPEYNVQVSRQYPGKLFIIE